MLVLGQIEQQLWRWWLYVTQTRSLAVFCGIGFALLAITLLIASRTRWGQAKPLTKCIALSVLAHVWLLMYALGSRAVLPQGEIHGRERSMSVSFEGQFETFTTPSTQSIAESSQTVDLQQPLPWEQPVPLSNLPQPEALANAGIRAAMTVPELLPLPEPTPMPALPPPELMADQSRTEATAHDSNSPNSIGEASSAQQANEPPSFASMSSPQVAAANDSTDSQHSPDTESPQYPQLQNVSAANSPVLPPELQLPENTELPPEYQLRQAPNRLQLSAAFGADADTEASVKLGLNWLVGAQSSDGSWDAKRFGAGQETHALGESRYGTGDKADTGVSGLALLAFLSAGHTHLDGEFKATVQQGLRYLLRAQMPSGDLSGPKQVGNDRGILNARMYCHSIATLALAEAHAMTGDVALRDALLRAAQYSINAQDTRGGGWRYSPHDPGDLSQFGWQAMALRSVDRSSIPVPGDVKQRMRNFLDSCSAGPAGGLATYRPKEGRPSETMTAESLACRLLLDYPTTLPARYEATKMIMDNRPGVGADNVYFWYYATLALFQLQDENWRDWNQAMKQKLLATQAPAYSDNPGSWQPDGMWGGYGGRVYSTAMSCLCLEVYYRYLPMYRGRHQAADFRLQR